MYIPQEMPKVLKKPLSRRLDTIPLHILAFTQPSLLSFPTPFPPLRSCIFSLHTHIISESSDIFNVSTKLRKCWYSTKEDRKKKDLNNPRKRSRKAVKQGSARLPEPESHIPMQASSLLLFLPHSTRLSPLSLSLSLTKQPSGYAKVSWECNVFFASSEG